MEATRPDRLAVLAAVVTVLLWASAFVVIRFCGSEFNPGALAFLRLGVGTIALTAVAAIYRPPLPRGRGLALVVGYGLLWFAAYTVVLNWAEQHLDAGTAALLVNFAPILVAVFAGFFLSEGFPRPLVVGIVIAFIGVVLISLGGSGVGVNDHLGVGLGLLAAVLYAAGVLLQKVALRTVNAISATWVGCAIGLAATAPFALQAIDEIAAAPPTALAGVVFLGVGPTAIAFLTWAYALNRTDAGKMAATTLAVPAIAILMSWFVLGEVPTVLGFAGGALALGGVAISRRRARPRREPQPAEPCSSLPRG
ncbi:DMT family transporter [Mycolicibacterium sp.]|uniref:DMT family transporter n=1 Tax=Mycolicibacterium sp. TaxID=2320850 RepID=UPI001A1D7848|nr:DMT family transporter [Mycolicibacterium sp.]MBJ7337073.1 DMT family transporter [Mycolicibacterium sp.]